MSQRKKVIKVIGIDASTRNIGWSVVTYHREMLVASGQINISGEFYERLKAGPGRLLLETIPYIKEDVAIIAIEHSFFTKNPDTGKKITMMIGACIHTLMAYVGRVKELAPAEIKRAFTGDGKADKVKVQAEVLRRYRLATVGYDQSDAIAIACSYIRLHKQGYFKGKAVEKKVKDAARARKRAAAKAAKTKKPLEGELNL